MIDREKILQKAIHSPASLSDDEIEYVLSDSELEGLYRTYAALKMATRLKKHETAHKTGLRKYAVAASIAGVVFLVSALIISIRPHSHGITKYDAPTKESVAPTPDSLAVMPVPQENPDSTLQGRTFNNETLGEILDYISNKYRCSLKIEDRDVLGIRMYFEISGNQSLDEIVRQLDTFESFDISIDSHTITVR